jgi:hypothetical protein
VPPAISTSESTITTGSSTATPIGYPYGGTRQGAEISQTASGRGFDAARGVSVSRFGARRTRCAYATGLRLWFEFLGHAGVGWADADVGDAARFAAWLRAPAGNVVVLETGAGRRSPATVTVT